METIKQLKEENKQLCVALSPYEMETKDQYDMGNLAEMVDELQAENKQLKKKKTVYDNTTFRSDPFLLSSIRQRARFPDAKGSRR